MSSTRNNKGRDSLEQALPKRGLCPERRHVFEPEDLEAIQAALDAERPLLLRGEPGTGKSQLAEAAAARLGRPFVERTVDGRIDARDLKYEIDFVARLAEAQSRPEDRKFPDLDLIHYTRPGPLWWAFDWAGAAGLPLATEPERPEAGGAGSSWQPGDGCVVLIDEIDKAEPDVPNGLLDALGVGRFAGPDGRMVVAQGAAPLIIITTNRERELPDAFLRRCLVHTLRLPRDEAGLVAYLLRRGKAHFTDADDEVMKLAATCLVVDRTEADRLGEPLPGVAEYLDLLRILRRPSPGSTTPPAVADQIERLERVRSFVFQKFDTEDDDEASTREPSA
ncbi:MAG: MoxR family ATPase [Planctomycetes bacterium]|nr:MoxR family ATPase [Planctomycetota bacterium]